MIKIFEDYGYPDRRVVGTDYEEYLFYILLHSTPELIEQFKVLVFKSMDEYRLSKDLYPFLIDRHRLLKGELQLFGTQEITNEDGELELYGVEDKKNLNKRREKYGLDPIDTKGL